jgi:hypothetical protein
MPFTIYYTFWLEERHGFNKQVWTVDNYIKIIKMNSISNSNCFCFLKTPGFFIKDTIKKYILGILISLPLVAAVIFIVQSGGDYFFLYLWIFVTLVIVLLMTVYPDYIAPLFDKYSPLQEGELKSQIEKLAASIDFPLKKLYVVEGNRYLLYHFLVHLIICNCSFKKKVPNVRPTATPISMASSTTSELCCLTRSLRDTSRRSRKLQTALQNLPKRVVIILKF